MHKRKACIVILVVAMLIVTLLVGCRMYPLTKEKNVSENESNLEVEITNKEADMKVSEHNDTGTNYEVATVRWEDWGEDYHTGYPDAAAEEVAINISWNMILNTDWGDRKAVLLEGGDLPDAFMGSICFSETDILTNIGTFIALDDYIDEYMPNFKRILEYDSTMKALATSADGHIYGLPSKKPCRPTVSNQMFINQTWLDNLGIDMPTTYDEFVNVLRAFKEQDANGNGDPNDEIPYGEGFADSVMFFCVPFGVTPGGNNTYSMTLKDGKVVFIPTSEEYKAGITAMQKCYAEGLIDTEIFIQDDSMRDAKLMNTTPVIGCAPGWTADATFGANADQYVALPALKGPDGKQYISSDPEHWNYSRYEFVVTSTCENPGKLLSWIDKFYTEEASIQNFYGSFGIGVEKDEETGTYIVLEPKEDMSADLYAWVKSLRDFGPKYVVDGFNDKVTYEGENGDAAKLEIDKNMKSYASKAYPNVSYTVEQLEMLGALYSDMESYIGRNQAAWVTEGGIEEEWDRYIDTLNQMGYEDFIKIQIDAYNTYRINK
ncbi:extracellular solute-binding protein [Anaerosporobacter sp.]|uniref:extracellular solute-binding protein n=1 Tax=Anaerosporobacter sp. TaxID=1872529 RepID=UPI00286F5AF9|nr:extracellular solute-binding protein [Anaerosporobacter sp.]